MQLQCLTSCSVPVFAEIFDAIESEGPSGPEKLPMFLNGLTLPSLASLVAPRVPVATLTPSSRQAPATPPADAMFLNVNFSPQVQEYKEPSLTFQHLRDHIGAETNSLIPLPSSRVDGLPMCLVFMSKVPATQTLVASLPMFPLLLHSALP